MRAWEPWETNCPPLWEQTFEVVMIQHSPNNSLFPVPIWGCWLSSLYKGETEAGKVEVTGPKELKLRAKPFPPSPDQCFKMPHDINDIKEFGKLFPKET